MPARHQWIVVKFGGTSVSTLANWRNIALIVKRRLEAGHRALVVHSAITRITDMLEKLLASAQAGKPDDAIAILDKVMADDKVHPQIRQVAQAERVRAIQAKGGGAKPASPSTPAAPTVVEPKK